MYYIIYLTGLFLLLILAACSNITMGSLLFLPSQLANFTDIISFLFIIIPCVLVLFCTKSFRAFGRSFLFILGKNREVGKDSVYAIGAVMGTAVMAGAIHMGIGIINSVRNMALTGQGASNPGIGILVSLLSPLYALIFCMILVPVLFSVWKQVRTNAVVHPQKGKRIKR